jgi:hypothetical protein
MKQISQFLQQRFRITNRQFKLFFLCLFGTTLITYINAIFVFLPETIIGFNWSGIAWITALIICLIILPKANKSKFPLILWIPWLAYALIYVILDFTFAGLQLTLQYLLPILMGYLAGSFRYSVNNLLWILQSLIKTTLLVFAISMYYKIFSGYSVSMSATPMFLLVLASLSVGFYFFTNKKIYLFIFGVLFLMPFLNVTRMAMLVFCLTYILHFTNKRLSSKITTLILGGGLLLLVASSKGFQEKTFNGGSGEISELNVNYYEGDNFNSNGRKSWKLALESGLESAPLLGNGPRADAPLLGEMIGAETGEAHNDYMSIRFNYGFIGLGLLLFGFVTSFIKMFIMSQTKKEKVFQLLILTNLTLYIGFLMFMYSDNILKYTIWFPNYFFVMMGICFSLYKSGFAKEESIRS